MKTVVLIAALLMFCSTVYGAQIGIPVSSTNSKLKIAITGNTDVSALNFTVSGLPIKSVSMIGHADKGVAYNSANGKVIVYGLNNTLITDGDVLEVEFTLPNPYGRYTVTISDIAASKPNATYATVTKGADGIIAITFQTSDVVATASQVVGLGNLGIDVNKDGIVDIVDVQILSNNL